MMKKCKQFLCKNMPGVVMSLLLVAAIFYFPATGYAYNYQNSEYKFEIATPKQPSQTAAVDNGIALDLSQGNEEYPVWLIQQDKKNCFIDPTTLSQSKQQEYFDGISKEDYGAAKCQKADIIKVGKYNGTLLVNKEGQEMMAMAMFKADKENYIVTLVTTENRFDQDFKSYQQYLATFSEF